MLAVPHSVLAHVADGAARWRWGEVLTHWHLEPFTVLALGAGVVAYGVAVRRVRRRGGSWPAVRTWAMTGALAALAVGLASGLAGYEATLFSAHASQHLLVGMIAPLLMVLAAPMTLALRVAPRRLRPRLHRVIRHPLLGALTHPALGWALFGGTLVALYFTPLYELSLRNDLVHGWLHLHLFAAGFLFYWPLVGADPLPRRPDHLIRLLAVVVAVPFHAFVAVALLTTSAPLALDWYQQTTGRSAQEVLADQRTGAGLLWVAGELLSVAAIGIVVVRWVSHEQRVVERVERLSGAAVSS